MAINNLHATRRQSMWCTNHFTEQALEDRGWRMDLASSHLSGWQSIQELNIFKMLCFDIARVKLNCTLPSKECTLSTKEIVTDTCLLKFILWRPNLPLPTSLSAVQMVHSSLPTTSECLLTPKNAGIPQASLDVFQAYVFKLHKWVYIDT